LIGVLASQAIMGLGAVGDSKTGRIVVDLPGAQFSIDLLAVLEQKTRGNLADEEARELQQVLAELRHRYVEISDLVMRQAAMSGVLEGVPGAAPGGPVMPGGPGGVSGSGSGGGSGGGAGGGAARGGRPPRTKP
jgi:hypothetical protein